MKTVNIITLLLIIIGGLNWGLVGLADIDLVAALLGGRPATLARIVYIVVGIAAVWQLIPFIQSLSADEDTALRNRR